jgi:hypothetical protein
LGEVGFIGKVTRMKRNNRIFLLVTMIIIALVIGSFVIRQVEMLPYEIPLSPSPFPTVPINPTITVTVRPELLLLSPLLGNILLETASAGEGTQITPIGTVSPTLCPPSDVICPGGNATLNPQQAVYQLMASAEGTEYAQLVLTATALATSPAPTASPVSTPS